MKNMGPLTGGVDANFIKLPLSAIVHYISQEATTITATTENDILSLVPLLPPLIYFLLPII